MKDDCDQEWRLLGGLLGAGTCELQRKGVMRGLYEEGEEADISTRGLDEERRSVYA